MELGQTGDDFNGVQLICEFGISFSFSFLFFFFFSPLSSLFSCPSNPVFFQCLTGLPFVLVAALVMVTAMEMGFGMCFILFCFVLFCFVLFCFVFSVSSLFLCFILISSSFSVNVMRVTLGWIALSLFVRVIALVMVFVMERQGNAIVLLILLVCEFSNTHLHTIRKF